MENSFHIFTYVKTHANVSIFRVSHFFQNEIKHASCIELKTLARIIPCSWTISGTPKLDKSFSL
jgi:hypothetical protein